MFLGAEKRKCLRCKHEFIYIRGGVALLPRICPKCHCIFTKRIHAPLEELINYVFHLDDKAAGKTDGKRVEKTDGKL